MKRPPKGKWFRHGCGFFMKKDFEQIFYVFILSVLTHFLLSWNYEIFALKHLKLNKGDCTKELFETFDFSGTPEILRVWRFKWAMWKVRGIKIERTPLWYFFPRLVKRPTCKSNFGRWNSTPKTRELYFNLTRTSIKRCVLIILCRDWFLLFVFSQVWEISVYIMSNSGGTIAYIHYSLRLLDAVCSAHLPNIICWCQFL